MATTWNNFSQDHAAVQLPSALGLVAAVALPVATYGLLTLAASSVGVVAVASAPFGLPAWSVQAATVLTLGMAGAAQWIVSRHGRAGLLASGWIMALMAGIIVLPFALLLASPWVASLLSMVVLLVGVIAMLRASALSATAGLLLLPGLVWMGIGSMIGFTTLAGGWSPPFALIDTNRH